MSEVVRVHRGGEDHPWSRSAVPAAEDGAVLVLCLACRRAGSAPPVGPPTTPWPTRSPCCTSPRGTPTGCRGFMPSCGRLERRVNRKRVERIMRERGITGVTRRKRRSLTRPAKRAVPAADLIGRDFTADAPGRKLVGDITFISTDEGWLPLPHLRRRGGPVGRLRTGRIHETSRSLPERGGPWEERAPGTYARRKPAGPQHTRGATVSDRPWTCVGAGAQSRLRSGPSSTPGGAVDRPVRLRRRSSPGRPAGGAGR